MSDKRTLNDAKWQLSEIRRFVEVVGPRDLDRAFAKGQHRQVDGFPPGGDSERRSNEISDPTGNAVMALMTRLDMDNVGDALRDAFTKIQLMHLLAEEVMRAFDFEKHVNEQASKRHVPAGQGDCMVCDRFCSGAQDDRLKAGFCDACRKAWERYVARTSLPDRARFMVERKAKLAEVGDAGTAITARQAG